MLSADVNELLSPACLSLLNADSGYSKLVVSQSATPPGALRNLSPEQLLARPVQDRAAAEAMLAGLWLWHDCLNESHAISQKIENTTGSFWHAIMHRREGDFSNAKYWYARCRTHPAMALIGPDWDPAAFVDRVQSICKQPAAPDYERAVELQRLEWRELFAWCARTAAGA